MRLLVSCNTLLLVDAGTRECSVVHDAWKGYYGVSWTPDGQDLAVTHTVHHPGETPEHYMDAEGGHLTLGARAGVECLSEPHQIL
ncbi:MAG: hypothetical protein ACRC33_14295, partial [Gemmataceae bacterium]